MNLLNRNQYAVLYSYRCNYKCSYCCTSSSPKGPKSGLETNARALCNLLGKLNPGCILLSGGEPALWEEFPIILKALPTHYWVLMTNLSILPNWIDHQNIKLIIPAYHEEFVKAPLFIRNLEQLKEMGKRMHVKIIVKPGQEYSQLGVWEKINSMGIPASLTPLEYTAYFKKTFLQDLISNFRTCCLYNSRFFRINKPVNRWCIAGTEKMFQVNPDNQIIRCSSVWTSVGDIFQPGFDGENSYCTNDSCYCEWHHWSSMSPANDNNTWTDYIETGVWKVPSIDELHQFIIDMNWDVAVRNIEGSTKSL